MEAERQEKAFQRLKEINVISEDFIAVKENSTLVVGASVGENTTGRDFYNDPTFYLLGLDIHPELKDGRDRFIAADLNNSNNMTLLKLAFNQKFETVIIDVEVIKYIRGLFSKIIEVLCNMIVPGGKLIFLKGHEATQHFLTEHNTLEYTTENKLTKSEIYATIKVKPIADTIAENPKVGRVYEVFQTDQYKIIKEDAECVIIQIGDRSGGGKKRRSRKSRKSRKSRRSRRSKKTIRKGVN